MLNCGINLTNPSLTRNRVAVGGPEMAALKMAVDGVSRVLKVLPVVGRAWGRGTANLLIDKQQGVMKYDKRR